MAARTDWVGVTCGYTVGVSGVDRAASEGIDHWGAKVLGDYS